MKAFIKDVPFGMSVIAIILAAGFVYIAIPIFGNSALIVRSGSMQPQIAVGDLAVVKKQAGIDYKVGDIIAFKNAGNSKTLTTHRIAAVENQNGKVFYQTKGDANKTVDREPVSAENVIGKAYFRLPYLGKLIAFTKTSTGFALAVIFPALLVIAFEIQNIFREIKKQKSVRPEPAKQAEYPSVTPIIEIVDFAGFSNRHKLGFRMPSLKILLPLLASAILVYNSFAFFSDTETSTGNIFTAAESFGPGPGDVVINEIMWMGSTASFADEWIELRNMTGEDINIGQWGIENARQAGQPPLMVPADSIIPANGFFLIARTNPNSPNSALNVVADDVNSSMSLADSGNGHLILRDNNDNIIDQAKGDTWPAGVHGGAGGVRQSMERKFVPGNGLEQNNWHTCITAGCNSGTFWKTADGPNYGTPKAANSL